MGRDLSITAAQIELTLDEGVEYEYTNYKGETETYEYNNSNFWREGDGADPVEFPDSYLATYVDGETGGEGSAEHIWQVWKFENANKGTVQYFMKTGYYMSYDGSNWDGDLVEVEPFEKTVTDWRDKK